MNLIKLLNNRKVIFFILFIGFISILFPQKRKKVHQELSKKQTIYFETHLIPKDSLFKCFVLYKIPYNHLLFVKENGNFNSELSITFEIFKKDTFISRVFVKKTISTTEYEKTNISSLYLQGITSFEIGVGEYRILPSILLGNTDIEIKSPPLNLLVDSIQVSRPLIVSNNYKCDSLNIELVNFQNTIPFSKNEFDLLIPIYFEDDLSLNVQIKQDEKIIIDKVITEFEFMNSELLECNNIIIVDKRNKSELIKYFRLKFVNKNLIEGDAKIFIKSENIDLMFDMNVFWNDKPKSLFSKVGAINAMKIIGYRNIADSLSKIAEDEQYKALYNFWLRFDDDNSTSFNEVFDEFYSRIDFVKEKYNSLGKNDALDTDRGKTYILFGKPDKIERTYSEIYNVLEVWVYNSLNEKIYFSDKTGTGKFKRIK